MKVEEVPPLPTREQEVQYLKDLENSFLDDPWITLHPRKYMAGPWRLAYKNYQRYKKEYYKTFVLNGIVSFFAASPLIL